MSNVYNQHTPKSEGGGLYLKLDDGEVVRVRIASEPVIFENDYQGNISTRYAWLVWNTEAGTPHVLQQSATFFRNLANYAKDPDYGDPTLYDIKIRREGTGTDTIYHITPSPKPEKLSDEAKAELAKLDLLELVQKGKGVQHAMWLSDFVKGKEPAQEEQKEDDVVQEVGDEPFDLNDIPF